VAMRANYRTWCEVGAAGSDVATGQHHGELGLTPSQISPRALELEHSGSAGRQPVRDALESVSIGARSGQEGAHGRRGGLVTDQDRGVDSLDRVHDLDETFDVG